MHLAQTQLRQLTERRDGLAELREQFAHKADAETRRQAQTERAIATIEGTPQDLWSLSFTERRQVLRDLCVNVWLYPSDAEVR